MCLPCLSLSACLIEFLPYILLVTVPFFGSFGGIDVILRLSLLIYLYISASEIVPKSLVRIHEFSNETVLWISFKVVDFSMRWFPFCCNWQWWNETSWKNKYTKLIQIFMIYLSACLNYFENCSDISHFQQTCCWAISSCLG